MAGDGRFECPQTLVPLDVHHLPEGVDGLHQVPGLLHDQVDVLVGPGHLVKEGVRAPDLDALHLPVEVVHGEGPPGLAAAHAPSGPVGGGVEGRAVAQPPDHVAAGAHGAWDEPHLALPRLDRSLAGDEDVLPPVVLPLGEVVVALDAFLLGERPGPGRQGFQRPVGHLVAVEPGELLAPLQICEVVAELLGVLGQVGQVFVGQLDEILLHQLLRRLDMELGHLVADAPAAGVEEGPDPVVLVQHHLDEVVSGPQGAELPAPVPVPLLVEVEPAGLFGHGLELGYAWRGGLSHLLVVLPGRQGHLLLDVFPDPGEVMGEVRPGEGCLDRDHAAADVDADGGGYDGPFGGDAGADGRAEAEVAVRHDGHMAEDERHAGGVPDLGQGLGLYLVLGDP